MEPIEKWRKTVYAIYHSPIHCWKERKCRNGGKDGSAKKISIIIERTKLYDSEGTRVIHEGAKTTENKSRIKIWRKDNTSATIAHTRA